MNLLLAGDFHGNSTHAMNVFARAKRGEAEAIIQLGDLGYGWRWGQRKITGEHYDEFMGHLSKFSKQHDIPLYWIDGNHENFDALEDLMEILTPQPDGTYQIEDNVFYIPRGTVLTFGGKTFLFCGGACSIDQGQRTMGVSWWPQEMIREENIEKCAEAGTVDMVVTHDFPIECDIIDRHLDPWWGIKAQHETIENRTNVSRILDASGAKRLIHGHLHIRYTEMIKTKSGRDVMVVGLDCDNKPMRDSTYLLDTNDIESMV